jgi:hypothetical protein
VALHGGDVTIRSRVGEARHRAMPLDCEQTAASQDRDRPWPSRDDEMPPPCRRTGAAVAARDNATVVKKSA